MNLLPRKKLKLGISLKNWAMMMSLANIILGVTIILAGAIWLAEAHVNGEFMTNFIFGCIVGTLSIFTGILLIVGTIGGKENLVLRYILLETIILFILTIFSSINVSTFYPGFTIVLLCSCPFLWLGLFNIFSFYNELNEYNNSAVQAGIDEIACHTNVNPLAPFPEKAVESTSV